MEVLKDKIIIMEGKWIFNNIKLIVARLMEE